MSLNVNMINRHIAPQIRIGLEDTRVVAVVGPRQSGKTTLARQIAKDQGRVFLSLDDAQTRAAALNDPTGLLRGLEHVVIDEIQRAPDLILTIKQIVDENPRPGRFLITGSADLFGGMIAPDSLAGRVETFELLPLSQSELSQKRPSGFVDALFAGDLRNGMVLESAPDLVQRVLRGGYPEAVRRATSGRRADWLNAYAKSLAERDVPELAGIRRPDALSKLAYHLALRTGQLLVVAPIATALKVDIKTADRWIGLYEKLFFAHQVQAWHDNELKRLIKAPKLQLLDSGLAAALSGINEQRIARDRGALGALLETFVYGELRKLTALSPSPIIISHFRDKEQNEVDFVLERIGGDMVGIEVKSAATVFKTDAGGLIKLRNQAGERFIQGVILYDGDRIMTLGDRIEAVPFSALWAL
jgi:predicted AAA+ superfamily ATPase